MDTATELNTNLDEFTELALRAHYWTSHSPHRRGEQLLKEVQELLNSDIELIKEATDQEKQRYIETFKVKFRALLIAKSNCMSSMITGPANFPVRKAEKANNREHALSEEFYTTFRTKAQSRIQKNIESRKPKAQKVNEAWVKLEKSILSSVATIRAYDEGIDKRWTRALFVSSIVGSVERLANKGEVELVELATKLISDQNNLQKKPIISPRNKFFKFIEVANQVKESIADKENKEDLIHKYDGFQVVISYADDRIRIVHDEKPSREVIQTIKSHGFRWSPRNTAWQRQLTNNAMYVTFKLLLKDQIQIK